MKSITATTLLTVLAAASVAMTGVAAADPFADPGNLPAKSDKARGQTGYNDCQKRYGSSSPTANCQNAYINSAKDFCLFAPPGPKRETIGASERYEVSWCLADGYGTRLIPDGTLKGVHFVKTPSYVQVTGNGDFTKMNVVRGDAGGELDPHGADGAGNPIGSLVYTNAYTGAFQRQHEWQQFMSATEFCFRACSKGPNSKKYCPHIYDVMGCMWNEPANYDNGVFEDCEGKEGKFPGIYGSSTFYQGQKPTPPAHKAPSSSNCKKYKTVKNQPASAVPTPPAPTPASS